MRVDETGAIILSRRNLLTLLHKLDVEGSKRTILKDVLIGDVNGHTIYYTIAVRSEPDMVHYAATGMQPGEMSADSEEFITSHEKGK